MSLENQKIVVIGGSSGMGLAVAQKLALSGATVVITSRAQSKADEAKAQIKGNAEARALDFADEAVVKDFFANEGNIDHLVLVGSGQAAWGNLVDIDSAALRQAFDAKFWGYFYCAKYSVPHLRKDGSITFAIGAAARTAIPGTAGVAAVNGAIATMARTFAKEAAPLRVNVLSPGLIDTPAYDWMNAEEKQAFFEKMGGEIPVGRVGHPQEIAEAVYFLVSNNFTTGAVLDVDGGQSLS